MSDVTIDLDDGHGGFRTRPAWIGVEGQAIFTRFREPAEAAAALERTGELPAGSRETYVGYAVMGVAFESGDILALRRFPCTSTGPGYTSVWHRGREGTWTFYTDVAARGCVDHFASARDAVVVAPIRVEWNHARRVVVSVDAGRRLTWSLLMHGTPITRAFNALSPAYSPVVRRHPALLRGMAALARLTLRVGPIRLSGRTPNGASFTGQPWALWVVRASRACIEGRDTGPDVQLQENVALGDFRIPARGLFAAAVAEIIPTRPSRARAAAARVGIRRA